MDTSPMSRWMRTPPSMQPARPWWLLIAAYYGLNCTMHLEFSLWLVRQRSTALGRMAYADLMPAVVLVAALAMAITIARQLRVSPRPWITGAYWLAWLAGVAIVDRFLTFSINEYFHYPQYAGLAWLLARALDPGRTRWYVGRVLFWTTLLGAADELFQYLWITTSYSYYLDFNDFLVNLLAAAAGVLLYYGSAALPKGDSGAPAPRIEVRVAIGLVLAVTIGLQAELVALSPSRPVPPGGVVRLTDDSWRLYLQRGPDFYGSWQAGPRHGRHYVLPPVAGLGWVIVAGMLFAGFGLPRLGGVVRFRRPREVPAASGTGRSRAP
jgi:hypothetical protein